MRRLTVLAAALALVVAACSGDDAATSATTDTTVAEGAVLGLDPGTITAGIAAVDDVTRTYLVAVPPDYSPDVPAPLIFDLHGRGGTAPGQAITSGITELAWAYGYVVVHPQAEGEVPTWAVWPALPEADAEVEFFRMMLDAISAELNIDLDRVFVMGYSNGGGMASRLACEMADRITAVAAFGGSHEGWLDCVPSEPVSVLGIHGLDDEIVPFGGASGDLYPDLSEWAARWAELDGCTDEAVPTPLPTGTYWHWSDCEDGTTVSLIGLAGWGHDWPTQVHQVSTDEGMVWQGATEVMLAFFNRQ